MRTCTVLFFLLAVIPGAAQSISNINFSYWYNLEGEVKMEFHPVMQGDSIVVFYTLRTNSPSITYYDLQWEKKDSFNQRQGAIIKKHDSVVLVARQAEGRFRFAKPEKPWLLVARVTNTTSAKSWIFFKQIEAHYPVNGFLEKNGEKQWRSYIIASDHYTVHGSGSGKPINFSYYRDNFPTPSPPFADKELKLDRFLFPDSTFSILPGREIGPFSQEGLYLAQEDTVSSQGFSFIVKKEPYPKFNKLGDLKGPLLFVTTREENDLIGAAGEDKAKFDKVILDITSDKERAKVFMRNYFKRVEYANATFTSYKEGWKTDRGMIVIIFGAPDEVLVSGQREIWGYRNPRVQFDFIKSGSVYHPDHYVMLRDKQYAEDWYLTVDQWRKSRY